jgi:hypothetical protein
LGRQTQQWGKVRGHKLWGQQRQWGPVSPMLSVGEGKNSLPLAVLEWKWFRAVGLAAGTQAPWPGSWWLFPASQVLVVIDGHRTCPRNRGQPWWHWGTWAWRNRLTERQGSQAHSDPAAGCIFVFFTDFPLGQALLAVCGSSTDGLQLVLKLSQASEGCFSY